MTDEADELLRTMPDAAAFMWTLDGIDPGGTVRAWMERRAKLFESGPTNRFTFRIVPVTKDSIRAEMEQDYDKVTRTLGRIRWLASQLDAAPERSPYGDD